MSTGMDIQEILKTLPHRFPFVLVDRVLQLDKGQYAKAIKNVTINEPFFPGHFPARPVMPGVLVIEALAQAAAMLAFVTKGTEAGRDKVVYLVGMEELTFPGRRAVEGEAADMEEERRLYYVAVTRAADVLRCYSADRQDLTVTEVSRLLAMPKSNASRLLRAMAGCGLLETVGRSKRYRQGKGIHGGLRDRSGPPDAESARGRHGGVW